MKIRATCSLHGAGCRWPSSRPVVASGQARCVAASSFIATSLFALSGLVLGDHTTSVSDVVTTIAIALVYDVVLAPFLVPLMMMAFARTEVTRALG